MKYGSLGLLEWSSRFTYLKNVPFGEDDLRAKGAKFQIVKFAPGVSVFKHFHRKTCEIFYVRSGNGLIRINEIELRCSPDDFILCEPGEIHEFINDTEDDFVLLIFKTNEEEGDIHWCDAKKQVQ